MPTSLPCTLDCHGDKCQMDGCECECHETE